MVKYLIVVGARLLLMGLAQANCWMQLCHSVWGIKNGQTLCRAAHFLLAMAVLNASMVGTIYLFQLSFRPVILLNTGLSLRWSWRSATK